MSSDASIVSLWASFSVFAEPAAFFQLIETVFWLTNLAFSQEILQCITDCCWTNSRSAVHVIVDLFPLFRFLVRQKLKRELFRKVSWSFLVSSFYELVSKKRITDQTSYLLKTSKFLASNREISWWVV
jgi:hypothetical protein